MAHRHSPLYIQRFTKFPKFIKVTRKDKGCERGIRMGMQVIVEGIRCAINFPQDIWVLLCLSLHIRCEITSVPFHLTTANRS